MYTHINVCTHVMIFTHRKLYTYIRIYMYALNHSHIYTCIYMYTYIHIHINACVYRYTHIQTYIQTHTDADVNIWKTCIQRCAYKATMDYDNVRWSIIPFPQVSSVLTCTRGSVASEATTWSTSAAQMSTGQRRKQKPWRRSWPRNKFATSESGRHCVVLVSLKKLFPRFLFLLCGGVQIPCHSRWDLFLVRHQLR